MPNQVHKKAVGACGLGDPHDPDFRIIQPSLFPAASARPTFCAGVKKQVYGLVTPRCRLLMQQKPPIAKGNVALSIVCTSRNSRFLCLIAKYSGATDRTVTAVRYFLVGRHHSERVARRMPRCLERPGKMHHESGWNMFCPAKHLRCGDWAS